MNLADKVHLLTPLLAIFCIVAIEIIALTKGIDGTALAGASALIAGLGGYQVHLIKQKLSEKGKNGRN